MTELLSIIGNPYFWGLVFAYWIFNAAVEALPAPVETSGALYQWAYKFLNTLAGNIQEAFKSHVPGASQ